MAAAGGVGLGAAGGLMVGGLEFMGYRVYDPGVRGFVSVDPLAPVVGSGGRGIRMRLRGMIRWGWWTRGGCPR